MSNLSTHVKHQIWALEDEDDDPHYHHDHNNDVDECDSCRGCQGACGGGASACGDICENTNYIGNSTALQLFQTLIKEKYLITSSELA